MKALLGPNGLKVFARVVRFLSRIGNDLYFEATAEGLVLKAVNNSKTCYCTIALNEIFFSNYHITDDDDGDSHCRVSTRPVLQVLKNIKHVVSCQLSTNSELLIFDITKPKEIKIQYKVSVLEQENLESFEPSQGTFST